MKRSLKVVVVQFAGLNECTIEEGAARVPNV